VNQYYWPVGIVKQYAAAHNITTPPNEIFIAHGFAIPVLIAAFVCVAMSFMATRTRFGRYVFAIGGNPEAAELAGINTKHMTVLIFALMGFLVAISATISSARLNSATADLGRIDELYVIAAAVIGGTSLAGGLEQSMAQCSAHWSCSRCSRAWFLSVSTRPYNKWWWVVFSLWPYGSTRSIAAA